MDFATYWQYTDIITKFLFFALIALSISSWITGILRIYHSAKMKSRVVSDITQAVKSQSSQMAALSSAERKTLTEQILLQQIGRYRFSSEKGLPILGTTAAVAPFIGLFGTVWGIFHALHNIGATGQAGLGQVAGPVGEALIMTGLGLAVAIPAVIFYNICMRLNRKIQFTANDTAYGILADAAKHEDAGIKSTLTQKGVSTQASNNKVADSSEYSSSTVS